MATSRRIESAIRALCCCRSELSLRSSFGGSSNGRTADSDSASLGSNPSPPAISSNYSISHRIRTPQKRLFLRGFLEQVVSDRILIAQLKQGYGSYLLRKVPHMLTDTEIKKVDARRSPHERARSIAKRERRYQRYRREGSGLLSMARKDPNGLARFSLNREPSLPWLSWS